MGFERWVLEPLPVEQHRQGRTALRLAYSIAPWGFVYMFVFALLEESLLTASLGSAATGALLVAPLLRLSRSVFITTHWLNLGLTQSFLVPSWLLGGIETASVPWLAITVAVAAFVGGIREAVVWALLACVAVWGMYVAHATGTMPEPAAPEQVTWLLAAMAHSGLLAVVLAVVVAVVTVNARARDDLETARADAEVASEAKSSFLATMSHELRTPLNVILGYTELLLEDASGQDASDLRRIERSGRHLLGLINDVLDLSKVEAGQLELHLEPVDVVAVARQVLDASGPLIQARGNEARLHAASELRALADAVRIKQCLLNLVSNAAKFTEQGTIEVRLSRHDDRVRIAVEDTGRGMTAEELSRVFLPFVQANREIQIAHGGTGLGLALVRELAQQMGGRAEAVSVFGQGSTFSIELPCAPPCQEGLQESDPMERPGGQGAVAGDVPAGGDVPGADAGPGELRLGGDSLPA